MYLYKHSLISVEMQEISSWAMKTKKKKLLASQNVKSDAEHFTQHTFFTKGSPSSSCPYSAFTST